MRILKAILTGLVQGITEFLPISSSGHLVLLSNMGVSPPSVTYNLILHACTLAAVVVYLRVEVWEWLRHPWSKKARWLYLATVPGAIIGVVLAVFGEKLLLGSLLSAGFMLTSIMLILAENTKEKDFNSLLKTKTAILTGFAQGIAALPGVSRSGATISVMSMLGISREQAARLSFLMSIPIIAGGCIFECIGGIDTGGAKWWEITVAGVAAFISGILALKVMLRTLCRGSLIPYAVYTGILSIVSVFM